MRKGSGKPLVERIKANSTLLPDGCWMWLKRLDKDGYGQIRVGSRTQNDRRIRHAHVVSYECIIGPVPDGLQLDHLCRNRACVNPMHLEPVTNRVNTLRGFSPSAINSRKSHCPRGHELTGENLLPEYLRRGQRMCRKCSREQAKLRERIRRVKFAERISAQRRARYAAKKLKSEGLV